MDDDIMRALIRQSVCDITPVWTDCSRWAVAPLAKGDRIRIREGYDSAGVIGFYQSKANDEDGKVIVDIKGVDNILLAAAIEPYPYTMDEKIERAIGDLEYEFSSEFCGLTFTDEARNILFAILDAGV